MLRSLAPKLAVNDAPGTPVYNLSWQAAVASATAFEYQGNLQRLHAPIGGLHGPTRSLHQPLGSRLQICHSVICA